MAARSIGADPANVTHAPRWERRAEDRPGEILESALQVLAERGYARCRVDEVARRAGVSKGTVYVYFPAKIDLIRALVAQAPGDLSDRLNSLPKSESPRDRIRLVLDAIWSVVSNPHVDTIYRIVVAEPAELGELASRYVGELTERSVQVLASTLAEGMEAGVFRACDPVETARMLVALVFQHAGWLKDPALCARIGLASPENVVDRIEAFCVASLTPPTA